MRFHVRDQGALAGAPALHCTMCMYDVIKITVFARKTLHYINYVSHYISYIRAYLRLYW